LEKEEGKKGRRKTKNLALPQFSKTSDAVVAVGCVVTRVLSSVITHTFIFVDAVVVVLV
jgi:hypothetical protein